MIVLTELEGKRTHQENGYHARQVLRELEAIRQTGSLSEGVQFDEGGSIAISSDETEFTVADDIILECAVRNNATLWTNDLPLRIKADLQGVESMANDNSTDSNWTGVSELYVAIEEIEALYEDGFVNIKVEDHVNTCYVIRSGNSSALGRLKADGNIHLIRDKSMFGLSGSNAEQRMSIDLLADPDVSIVSLSGKAGTGKTIVALAAGLEQVLERRIFSKVTVFRNLYSVGGQDLGFLPGDADEKMDPWAAAIWDALESFCTDNLIEEIIARELIEVIPLTHIRGRTLANRFIIIEEAQNLDRMTLLTALSRTGVNSKVVLTHDINQRDNRYVGKHDGIQAVNNRLAGSSLYGNVTLTKCERSAVAALVSDLVEG